MAENAKRLNPGDHELLANISSCEELSYRDLEKVLGDQDDLAASRDEDPAEDSTDISADMYAYLLNRLKGRTLDWEPFAKVALSLYSVYKQDWLCLWMLWQDRIVKGNRSPTWRILSRRWKTPRPTSAKHPYCCAIRRRSYRAAMLLWKAAQL